MDRQVLSLVKFCSLETGLKILNSQSLRWSAPHLFEDPFEPDYRTQPDFTSDTLLRGMVREAISLLFGRQEPTGRANQLVAAIARWRQEERFADEDEAESVLNQLLGQIVRQQQASIDDYMDAWRQFTGSLRLCCFCDKPDNMAAWKRYGDNHNGIALKFRAGEDSALPEPRAVAYSPTPPQVTSLQEQVAVMYGRQSAPSTVDFTNKLLHKDREDRAEREWRCFEFEKDPIGDPELWYTNKTFPPDELKAVYLGLNLASAERETIKALLREHFGKVRLYQARALPGHYALEFEQVGFR